MKKTIKGIFAAIFAVSVAFALSGGVAIAVDAGGGYSSLGVGNQNCANVLEEHRKDSARYSRMETWVTGFMTAASAYNDTQRSFGDGPILDGIMHLIREYCDENPFDALTVAADNVAEEMIDRAGRR